MTLTATFRAGVETAFAVAEELVRYGTYISRGGDPVYDPVTDSMSGGEVQVPQVRMLQTSTTLEEREASPVSIEDLKLLIPFVDLPGRTPSQGDKVILDGVTYNVLTFKKIPGQAIHIVFCRKA